MASRQLPLGMGAFVLDLALEREPHREKHPRQPSAKPTQRCFVCGWKFYGEFCMACQLEWEKKRRVAGQPMEVSRGR